MNSSEIIFIVLEIEITNRVSTARPFETRPLHNYLLLLEMISQIPSLSWETSWSSLDRLGDSPVGTLYVKMRSWRSKMVRSQLPPQTASLWGAWSPTAWRISLGRVARCRTSRCRWVCYCWGCHRSGFWTCAKSRLLDLLFDLLWTEIDLHRLLYQRQLLHGYSLRWLLFSPEDGSDRLHQFSPNSGVLCPEIGEWALECQLSPKGAKLFPSKHCKAECCQCPREEDWDEGQRNTVLIQENHLLTQRF